MSGAAEGSVLEAMVSIWYMNWGHWFSTADLKTDLTIQPRMLDCVEELNRRLYKSEVEVYYTSVGWVLDIHRRVYLQGPDPATLDRQLRRANAVQATLWKILDIRAYKSRLFLEILHHSLMESLTNETRREIKEFFQELSRPPSVVIAVVLLALVYHYLAGNVDRGGSKAYSRSSLDFRDIYVAVVLFLGAYVWIKFREVAFKGVYSRKLTYQGGRITKVVYEPRFKPPRENGRFFERIYLGQYATPEEASILYQIAAFYYNENQGSLLDLEDGRWFSIPHMSEAERSLTGLEKRAWVKVQVMKVNKEFKKEKADAAVLQELLEAWEDQVPQEQDEGAAISNGQSDGSHEGPATLVSELPPNTQNGMGMSCSNQLDLLQTLVRTQQELITYQQQQISLQQQLQDCRAQISELKQERYLQQLLEDINGVPSNEMEMELSMHLQNHQSLVTLPCAGAEAQEAFI